MDGREDDTGQGAGERGKDDEGTARLDELKKTMEAKLALRQTNLNPERPDAGFLRTLDSSIKRNTAVIKKLKQINEEQKESLMEELRSVNLSKFVSEAVTAICDAKLRSSDIQPAVQICALLHQRYKDFSPSLVQGLLKIFFPGKGGDDVEIDKNTKIMKKRSTLKLLLELFFVGVIEDASIFISIIKDLTNADHLKDRDNTLTNLTLLASFARQGRVFLGLPLTGKESQEEFFKGLNITAEQKKTFKKAFHTYYESASELLLSEHSSLRQMEHENAKVDLSDESSSAYEKLRKSFEHLYRNISSLAEALDMNPPVMPEDANTTRVTSSGDDTSSPVSGKDSGAEALWDDEDTRAFYECLPDLRAFVPAVLLGESEPKEKEQSPKNADPTEPSPESDQADVAASSEQAQEDKNEKEVKGKEKENEREKYKGADGTSFDVLLQRLPNCVSRDLIDQLTVEFCYLNSKSNRKKLVRGLFNVPRTSLELLPYYSRMVATLSICMKDVSTLLLQMLEEEFTFLINKKDQMNIETKIRNIRFIGELCKFKIAPPGLVFSCLKTCLDDFTHHNIDVACNLLETCGRFLYRSPETTVRMSGMLEILMRLKNVKNLDPRHSTLVENAYYLCKPPERSARVSKVRPPLFQYIRKLLFSDLDKSSLEHVLRQLRKLPWSDCESYLLKCFMKIHKGKYSQIHLIACLTAGLSRYHEEFAISVVDEVFPLLFYASMKRTDFMAQLLEEIRIGLEENDFGMQQKRIGHMRFLGELYNYKLVDSTVIFETLYLVLSFGHDTPEADTLDPPEDCFRIRMVITLVLTCGHYFKRKLDRFLLFFQRYILCKGTLPLDIEFDVQDMLSELRPSMSRYSTVEEVSVALSELEESEKLVPEKAVRIARGGAEGGVESETESGSRTSEQEEEDVEEEYTEEEVGGASEEERVGGASEEEDEVRVRQKRQEIDPEEAARFENELRSIMQESMEQRRVELRGRPSINMVIPMNLTEGAGEGQGEGQGEEVQVKVLVKRGSKQQTRQMLIPKDCSLVQSTKQKEAAEIEEKQDIKRLVLEYNDRVEEETHALANHANNAARMFARAAPSDAAARGINPSRYRYSNHAAPIYHARRR